MFFGSDNQSRASTKVMNAMLEANNGFTHGYGDDQYTYQAIAQLEQVFERKLSVFFVPTGTASNCLALAALVNPWQTILCHSSSHILMDESTAPEFFTGGARLVGISDYSQKITSLHLNEYLKHAGDDIPHNPQVGAISITQANELGQVYSVNEVREISEVCQQHNIKLHMDGARFANAVASLNCTPAEITWQAGVDVLSLGATKCGALCAEAVIFFHEEDAQAMAHLRKRSGHLLSKGRMFGSQFSAWLDDDHWLDLARHANHQAQSLYNLLSVFDYVDLPFSVDANEIFVIMPKKLADYLNEHGAECYDWYPSTLPENVQLSKDNRFIRLVTSFSTTDEHIQDFVETIKRFYA